MCEGVDPTSESRAEADVRQVGPDVAITGASIDSRTVLPGQLYIPIVAEQVQIDTYLACGVLAETIGEMADNFVRDYLVERVEEMVEHRVMTGSYPRWALAAGQPFASKGGYLVRLSGTNGAVVADGNWVVP